MQTINVQAFKVQELEGEAAEKAYTWLSEINTSYNWEKDEIENFCEEAKDFGYTIEQKDVLFSGFYNQGDGASFAARVDLLKWINLLVVREQKYNSLAKIIEDEDIWGIIHRANFPQYVHEKMMSCEIDRSYGDDLIAKEQNDLFNELEQDILKDAQDMAKELYKNLEKIYEELQTKENLNETADANEYLFDKFGNPIHHLIA